MDMKKLLETVTKFAGQAVGQKPGEQWKGTDSAPPGKKLVGDSILKDLSKGPKAKTLEEELAEAFGQFNEDDLGVEEKRPGRTSDRPSREYTKNGKPSKRYTKIKENDEEEVCTYCGNPRGNKRSCCGEVHFEKAPIDEGWESGPEERAPRERDPDAEYDARRQEKADAAYDAERAKKPKKTTYSLSGRGPNMEPNYAFPGEYDSQDAADAARSKLMADPKTPNPRDIGIRTHQRDLEEGWGRGNDRISLPDEPANYYHGTGQLYKEYQELFDKLVPASGAADTIEGEVLRAASKIVYRHYNDGDEFNAASFNQLIPMIGKVTSYDDLAHKATEFALKANGNYHPNPGWDCLDVMEYGPEEDDEDDGYDDYAEYPDDDEDEVDEGMEEFAKSQAKQRAANRVYAVNIVKRSSFGGEERTRTTSGTIPELLEYFGYTLEVGKSYEHERGRYKINMAPKNIKSLVDNLNKAASNGARNGAASTYYSMGEEHQITESIESADPVESAVLSAVQELIQQGHTEVAPEVITNMVVSATSQPFLLKDLVDANKNSPAIQHYVDSINPTKVKFSSDILTVKNENPAKAKAQSKERAQAGVSSMASRAANRSRLGESGYTPLVDKEDYDAKRAQLQKIQMDPDTAKDPELKAELARRQAALIKQAQEMGISESRAHKIIANKLKQIELQRKIAGGQESGEEQHLRLIKQQQKDYLKNNPNTIYKREIDEYGANQPQGTAGQTSIGQAPQQAQQDPKQVAAAQQAVQTLKTATGSTAPAPDLAKAIDTASQGLPLQGKMAKDAAQIMGDINTIAQDPKLAGQFKTIANQANQAQQKQQSTT